MRRSAETGGKVAAWLVALVGATSGDLVTWLLATGVVVAGCGVIGVLSYRRTLLSPALRYGAVVGAASLFALVVGGSRGGAATTLVLSVAGTEALNWWRHHRGNVGRTPVAVAPTDQPSPRGGKPTRKPRARGLAKAPAPTSPVVQHPVRYVGN